MVENRIRVKCAEAGISQAKLATQMPDEINGVVLSFMSAGKVLPTREGLSAMCGAFGGCKVTEIYPDAQSIDLLGVMDAQEAAAEEADAEASGAEDEQKEKGKYGGKRNHEGMARFHAWLKPSEKEELTQMVAVLGYRNCAEWLGHPQRQARLWVGCEPVGMGDYVQANKQSGSGS